MTKHRHLAGFGLIGGMLLASSALAQMSTPSNFRVSETGAAVYEIPIKVPLTAMTASGRITAETAT